MRRTCTHCGTEQLIADEKLSTGWNFLRCHQCGAMAAVSGSGLQNLLRVTERAVRRPKLPTTPPPPSIFAQNAAAPAPTFVEPVAEAAPLAPPPIAVAVEPRITVTASKVEAPAISVQKPVEPARAALPRFKTSQWASAGLAVVCVLSGAYLLQTAKKLKTEAVTTSTAPVVDATVITKTETAAPVVKAAVVTTADTIQTSAAAPQERAINRSPAIVSRSDVQPANMPHQIKVLPSIAVLRAGPGLNFRKVGIAKAELQMLVAGSYDNWTEVKTEGEKTAWIRNDLVKPVAQVAVQTATGDDHERR